MAHLINPLATPDQLYRRNSSSSLPQDIQEAIFIETQCLTQAAGLLLDLPQSVTAQASVILARYWLAEAPMAHEFSHVSAASIFIVSKMGPIPRSPRDISSVYAYLLSRDSALATSKPEASNDPKSYYQTESDYFAFHNQVLSLEARILPALSFDTHVSLPHPLAITYLQTLDFLAQPKKHIAARTVHHLNTALLSPQLLYLTHQPNALATAAIYAAARDVGAKMPECAWWEVFDVDREQLGFLMVALRSLEGWMSKRREDMPWLSRGLITREAVNGELKRRGLHASNGQHFVDEEQAVMAMLDQR
ncbi:cyclin [Sarocladium implicatum]|nr:cyclin [Sarocladium implicatum]